MTSTILKTENLSKRFGGTQALSNVSVSVNSGEIVGIIGPNGSGKSTLIGCITRQLSLNSGRIFYSNHEMTKLNPYAVFRLGLARTFQITRLFWNLNCLQNLEVSRLEGISKDKEKEKRSISDILDLLNLNDKKYAVAKSLTLFEQKKLEIGMRLSGVTKVLILDEPVASLSETEMQEFIDLFRKLRDSGLTLIVIEHTMKLIFGISDRVIVLNQGEVIAEGRPKEIADDETVIEAYLGAGRVGH